MKVDKLVLKDFTVFADATFEFSPGLNVLIGANATGKSHVLKALYSLLRPMVTTQHNGAGNARQRAQRLGHALLEKMQMTFRPEPGRSALSSLIRHGADKGSVTAHGDFGNAGIALVGDSASTDVPTGAWPKDPVVFVPAAEVLSMYPGFVAAWERRELSFDETYRDLCVDLSASPLKTISPRVLGDVAKGLEEAVGGMTRLRGGKFFVSLAGDWLLEAPLLAEGLRKLASMAHLIRTGSLAKKSVLLWDEPEANMNPKLIPALARALLALAGAGVQVVAATHDYLLSNELSVVAEYGTPEAKAAKVRFFCLYRPGPRGSVEIQWGNTIADLPKNPILEEFAAHYDREQQLFARTPSSEP